MKTCKRSNGKLEHVNEWTVVSGNWDWCASGRWVGSAVLLVKKTALERSARDYFCAGSGTGELEALPSPPVF